MNRQQYGSVLISDTNVSQIVNYIMNINDIHSNYRPKMILAVKKELIDHYNKYSSRDVYTIDDVNQTNDSIIQHKTDDIIFNTITPNIKTKKAYTMPTIRLERYGTYDNDIDDGIHGSSFVAGPKKFVSKNRKWSRLHF